MSNDLHEFVSAYRAYFDRKWPAPNDPISRAMLDPSVAELTNHLTIRENGLGYTAIECIQDKLQTGPFPDCYKRFLGYAFRRLDLEPWIDFPSTLSVDGFVSALRSNCDFFRPRGYTPFAFGYQFGEVWLFNAEGAISIWLAHGIVGGAAAEFIIEGAFSDFGALLRVLTILISSGEPLCFLPRTGTPISAQELVRKLCATDAAGFGKIGWTQWGKFVALQ